MAENEIKAAIKQICDEKGLSYDAVIETIESALAAAYRKDYGKKNQNIKVEFNIDNMAKSKVFDVKTVVEDLPPEVLEEMERRERERAEGIVPAKPDEKKSDGKEAIKDKEADKKQEKDKDKDKKEEKEGKDEKKSASAKAADETAEEEEEKKFNPKTEIQLSDARLIKKTAKVGDEIKMKLEIPEEYGRMAAQTAKQVIIQRLREAEREMVFNDFKEKEHEVVGGVVQRREGRVILVDLGKSVGVLPQDEQIPGESYRTGERVKVYVKSVSSKPKGPEILLSRTSDEILKKVFYLEIPEISNGLIELKGVAREAGSRSKVAVYTDSGNVDPIGSCVGQRGARIQTIISELGGEKVDIIEYDEDPIKYIANALSPAKINSIETNADDQRATVKVSPDQLSLAIGKAGQNARLAARLTGWKIDITEDTGEADKPKDKNGEKADEKVEDKEKKETKDKSKDDDKDKKEDGGEPVEKKEEKIENKEDDKK